MRKEKKSRTVFEQLRPAIHLHEQRHWCRDRQQHAIGSSVLGEEKKRFCDQNRRLRAQHDVLRHDHPFLEQVQVDLAGQNVIGVRRNTPHDTKHGRRLEDNAEE